MSKLSIVAGVLVALGLGFLLGTHAHAPADAAPATAVAAAVPPAANVERYQVPIAGAPALGDARAKVTIVEFSDFECPFCARVEPTLAEVRRRYGDKVRLVWRNLPLPQHSHARDAALAALAAGERGQFWAMHDKLFANQRALERADLARYGNELGVDVAAALAANRHAEALTADFAEVNRLGVNATPSFYVNGRPLPALGLADFQRLIDEELANAERALAAGTPRDRLYDTLTSGARREPVRTPPPTPEVPKTVMRLPLGAAPARGPVTAKVTLVEFSDFECPACGRAEPMLAALRQRLGDEVRIVWKDMPLSIHAHARLAAEAARAAGAQGKFWEMHDKLFANQRALERADLERYAGEIGLDLGRFRSALDGHSYAAAVAADEAEAMRFDVSATPTFFVNGRPVRGFGPQLDVTIEHERTAAAAALARGIKAARLYDELTKDGQTAGGDARVYEVPARAEAPVNGPRSAPITLVEFSDFECPFCARMVDVVKQAEQKYPGRVRVVFRNYPLPMHAHAKLAAKAALAAGAQGKFWEMHDKLFANQRALERADLDRYARELGLDGARFAADLDGSAFDAALAADQRDGASLVNVTPTLFLNGHKLEGWMPPERLALYIDDELKKRPRRD